MPNTLSGLITEKELLDFSQNFAVARNYTGSRYFPDRKTQYIKQEYTRLCANGNLPQVAMVHAYDTEAHIASRVPFERVSVEELLIKEKINLTEEVARLTGGMAMDMDSTRNYVFDDIARMAEMVVTRAEMAKVDAIAKGKAVIQENGLDFVVDYDVPDENRVSGDWSDATADVLGDVNDWVDTAEKNGSTPNIAITSKAIVQKIKANQTIQKAIFGTSGVGILPTMAQINALFFDQFGITIVTDTDKYGVLKTNEKGEPYVEQRNFFPDEAFVVTATGADGTLGTGLWGVTPEEREQGGAFDSKRQSQFVTVTTWDTPDPVATWTKASGLFVPVLPNPYGHVIATVTTADDSEG